MPVPVYIRDLITISDDVFESLPAVAQDVVIATAMQSRIRAVTDLYDSVRGLPSFSSMSTHQVESVSKCVNDAHTFAEHICDPDARRDYCDMITYLERTQLWTHTVDVPPYSIVHGAVEHQTFKSRTHGGWRSYYGSSHTISFDSRLILSGSLVPALCQVVHTVIDKVKDMHPGCSPYQVTVTSNASPDVHYNSTLDVIATDLANIAEQYDNSFTVSSCTVNFTHGVHADEVIASSDIYAGSGEGIPRRVSANGHEYWIADIVASQSYCILYARHIWPMLTSADDCADLMVPTKRRRLCRQWVKDAKSMGVQYDQTGCSLSSVQELYPCAFRVITSIAMLERSSITPQYTKHTCCYYYDHGHVAVLVGDSVISHHTRLCLRAMSRRTVLSCMRIRKPIQCANPMIAVLDIECYREPVDKPLMYLRSAPPPASNTYKHVPLLIGLLVGASYTVYKGRNCIQQLLEAMPSHNWPCNEATIWIHNGGKYDTYLMFNDILHAAVHAGREPVRVVSTNGALVSVEFDIGTVHVTFKDSYRLLPASLSKLADAYGVPGKVYCDIVSVTETQLLHNDLYAQYVERDCKLLQTVLSLYREECASAGRSDPLAFSTQASFTRHTFLESYYDACMPIYTLPMWLHKYISRAYNGGRNEIYRYGVVSGPIYMYDFVSLYPHTGTLDLPYGIPRQRVISVSPNGVLATTSNVAHLFGFVEATIVDTPRNILPYYGIHKDGSYVFDFIYNQRVVMTTIELSRMVELGYTIRMHTSVQYNRGPVLKRMFESLFAGKRDSASRAQELTAKLATVSAYGVFGFNKYDRAVFRVYHRDAREHILARELSGSAVYTEHDTGMLLVNEKVHVHNAQCNVAIAAFITAYGRDILYQLMTDIEAAGGKLYYCDTDSVFTNYALHDDVGLRTKWMGIGRGTNLGELKHEYSCDKVCELVIAGLKVYGARFDSGAYSVKIRGINNPLDDGLQYAALARECSEQQAHINRVTTVFNKWPLTGITERSYPVRMSLNYDKGTILSDGTVQPISGHRVM